MTDLPLNGRIFTWTNPDNPPGLEAIAKMQVTKPSKKPKPEWLPTFANGSTAQEASDTLAAFWLAAAEREKARSARTVKANAARAAKKAGDSVTEPVEQEAQMTTFHGSPGAWMDKIGEGARFEATVIGMPDEPEEEIPEAF